MKIPGINGIKKTINANQRSKTIQAEYRQKYADYVAFAEQVQQDINELGEVRIAALRALDEAVKLTGQDRVDDHGLGANRVLRSEFLEVGQQNEQLASFACGRSPGTLAAGAITMVGTHGVKTAVASLPRLAAAKGGLAALGSALPASGPGAPVALAAGAAVVAGVVVIGAAEFIGAKSQEKADEAQEKFNLEAAKIDLEVARLRTIKVRAHELKTATRKLTEELHHAMLPPARAKWFVRLVATVKRLFTDKGPYDDVLPIAKSLNAIINEPIIADEQAK